MKNTCVFAWEARFQNAALWLRPQRHHKTVRFEFSHQFPLILSLEATSQWGLKSCYLGIRSQSNHSDQVDGVRLSPTPTLARFSRSFSLCLVAEKNKVKDVNLEFCILCFLFNCWENVGKEKKLCCLSTW